MPSYQLKRDTCDECPGAEAKYKADKSSIPLPVDAEQRTNEK
jgi:hypothetical protein